MREMWTEAKAIRRENEKRLHELDDEQAKLTAENAQMRALLAAPLIPGRRQRMIHHAR